MQPRGVCGRVWCIVGNNTDGVLMHDQTLKRILRVITYGSAALVAATAPACDDNTYTEETAAANAGTSGNNGTTSGNNATTSDNSATTNASTSGNNGTTTAPPDLPEVDESVLGCTGEGDEFSGPCCAEVACYEAGGTACADPETDRPYDIAASLGYTGLGSGTCLCGVSGPYDVESSHQLTDDTGECCYIISTQGCTGRPLTCDGGEVRTAPVTERTDWI